jgi:cytoskeleton protein RodZ
MTQGSQHELQGEAPYQIVIGNAAAASINIDGKPYDLSQHTRGNVARFILQL